MRQAKLLALGIALSVCSRTFASEPVEHQLFADAQVTVEPDGSVSNVELLRPEWPATLTDAALGQIRSLAFEPVLVDGHPARVTSSIRFSACLRADDQHVALALDPVLFGPQVAAKFDAYPRVGTRAFGSGGGEYAFTLKFRVLPDGRAQLDDVDAPTLSKWRRERILHAFGDWFEHTRFVPERVNDVPVETRMEWPQIVTVSRAPLKDDTVSGSCARARDAMESADGPRHAEADRRLRLRRSES